MILRVFRIRQWLKNLMLFFPPFFDGTLFSYTNPLQLLIPFTAFCLISSVTYILNDILDRENDRHHPDKCYRPIASGQIPVSLALLFATTFLIGSMALAWNISGTFLEIMMVYLAVSIAYSVKLKEVALLDIFCISAGFLLRLQAGCVSFNVTISSWLILSVFLLSIFLSAGKRLSEKKRLGDAAADHRMVLVAYQDGFLEGVMYMTGGTVLITYSMYVLTTRQSSMLFYSVPLCCFGLLRYIFRIRAGKSGDPTESLVRDPPMFIVGVLWVALVGWGIYGC